MNHKQLMQQVAEMKAQMDNYKGELDNLRNQVSAYENVENPIPTNQSSTTSRRRMLKSIGLGVAGFGAIAAAGAFNSTQVLAATPVASDNAIDVFSGPGGYAISASSSYAPLYLAPNGTPGAPTATGHQTGEIVVDSAGNFFFNVAGGASKWRKVAGPATAGALHLLTVPDRFVDTRNGLGTKTGAFAANTSFDFPISGATGRDGTVLPGGIVAVVGAITALTPSVGGLIKVLPGGTATASGTSVLNFGTTTVNTSFNSGLSSSGQLRVYFSGPGTVDVLLDIVGYYL